MNAVAETKLADLYIFAINLTQKCNLNCAHCYLDAETLLHGSRLSSCSNELQTSELCALLDQISEHSPETMVVLTGGEPLLRSDLEEIALHGAKAGLAMVVGTNGTMLTKKRVQSLQTAGVMGAGISVDSLVEQHHDEFRGKPGCWAQTMAGIENCRTAEFPFQLHFTISDWNAHELDDMIHFAQAKGAKVMNIFFLICTGRGESVSDISPQQYEQSLRNIVSAQEKYPDMIIRPRCAPHYKRIAYQMNPEASINRISGSEGDGCIAASHYGRVNSTGGVTPCPFIEEEVGNIREQSLVDIWQKSDTLEQLRKPKLEGDCGICEYQKLCGGCRARPYAQGQSLMAEDPWCSYLPQGGDIIEPLTIMAQQLTWAEDASLRLERIPGFIRKMVRKRTEAYVTDLGETLITVDHMNELAAKRFGGSMSKPPQHVIDNFKNNMANLSEAKDD